MNCIVRIKKHLKDAFSIDIHYKEFKFAYNEQRCAKLLQSTKGSRTIGK